MRGRRRMRVPSTGGGWRGYDLRGVIARALMALLLLTLSGCGSRRSVEYSVSVDPADTTGVWVAVALRGSLPDSLVLSGYAPREAIALGNVSASSKDGRALPLRVSYRRQSMGGREFESPVVTVPGPFHSAVTVRYRVRPGVREGDVHMGFNGRCHGFLGSTLLFATGRQLFLLPRAPETLDRIRVHFALPAGWTAVAPGLKAGGSWKPGISGRYLAEQLVSASIAAGRFRTRSFAVGRTRYQVAFEQSVVPEQEERTFRGILRIANYLHEVFPRGLGRDYLTIALPEAPDGDEIVGEAWAGGQGGTLVPLTSARGHDFAEGLLGVPLRFAPFSSRVRNAADYWVVDGATQLYAWKAVARAGLASDDEITRDLVSEYVKSLRSSAAERNLEQAYGKEKSTKTAREVIAPVILVALDRELRRVSRGADSLDTIFPRVFRGDRARSLWESLPKNTGADWDLFRERYVRQGVLAPVNDILQLPVAAQAPVPPRGRAIKTLTLAYTGKTQGYLENCGCKVNQSGGIARRSTILRRLRARDPHTLLLDAGSAFRNPDKEAAPDFLTGEEQAQYLAAMGAMGYEAVAVGTNELAAGPAAFQAAMRGSHLRYLASNVRTGGKCVAPPYAVVERNGVRVGVLGIYQSPEGPRESPRIAQALSAIQIEDPIGAMKREVPTLRTRADLVVVLGRLSPVMIRRAVAACPDIDVIISTDYDAPRLVFGSSTAKLQHVDSPGFLGRTLVLYTNLENYGLQVATLGLDADGRVTSADLEDCWLRSDVPDDPSVRRSLDRFYGRVGRLAEAQASTPPLFASDPERMSSRYVGAKRCQECHEAEYEQWRTTKHAGAYKTLLDVHRHFQPRCVSCHVVGFGARHGYRLGDAEEPLGNVQCEVCHGPGALHAEDPSPENISAKVPASICAECHTPEHSNRFVYEERIEAVRHKGAPGGAAREAAGRSAIRRSHS